MRKVQPAKNYDVVSFARAMNDDFAPRLKKLFDSETEAAIEAQKTGMNLHTITSLPSIFILKELCAFVCKQYLF